MKTQLSNQRTSTELLRYKDHPLKMCRPTCTKCKGSNVMAPSYPGDWFDCLDCGHSMAPTERQIAKMRRTAT